MQNQFGKKSLGFSTLPVFMTTVSTILGAILFLRFGYAVGHVGFWGVIAIIVLGHLVTLPTAFAVAEIATNQKVEGGGAYYIISRSFGLNLGAAIGLALYLSQAISVSFYVIAFSEAFDPVLKFLHSQFGFSIMDKRIISIPMMIILAIIMVTKGANIGVKFLYVIVGILFLSIFMFFIGTTNYSPSDVDYTAHIPNNDNFFYVFTIIFPAFTGIAAGLGLSGDLRDPKKSIPLGTLLATVVGIIVYIAAAFKMIHSASPEDLANDQLIMSKIAIWGPIIPIGLACATISSALGSVIVAPRTLQALGEDRIFYQQNIDGWLARGNAKDNEPINASVITSIIALFFVAIGSVNFIAEIISMFFMVTYGAICTISFLEHFAADPSYRPTFKSKWYFSLLGALLSIWLMFKMNMPYAVLSLIIMAVIYVLVSANNPDRKGLARLFKGAIFQLSRALHVFLQKSDSEESEETWRPSVVCISADSLKRFAAFDLLRWISYRYGFGTYIHLILGFLSKDTIKESQKIKQKLIKIAEDSKSKVFLDTIISPSYTSAIAQVIQLPGVSGKPNNSILFEYNRDNPNNFEYIVDNFNIIKSKNFDVYILGSTVKGFGYKKEIHVWIQSSHYENANLMILLSYIILGHPDWRKAHIKIFAVYPEEEITDKQNKLIELIKSGRLPISPKNIKFIAQKHDENIKSIINEKSEDADLTIIGFKNEDIFERGIKIFEGLDNLSNVLYVNTQTEKEIK